MTRLTDEQIREAWDEPMMADHVPKWDQLPILWFDKNRNFAHRIAALAVQEVEREHDARTFELECAKGDIATLTAQLAEARQSIAEEEARADAIATHRDAYRAQLATAKREAFCDGAAWELGAVGKRTARQEAERRYPATPSGEAKCADVAGCDGKCCATPSPEARQVPAFVLPVVQEVDAYVRITPADAKRIVAMGTEVRDA